jgi:hypothetical protein
MHCVYWKSSYTGVEGHGEFIFSEKEVKDIIEIMNKKYTDILHSSITILPPLNLKGHRCSYGDISFIKELSPKDTF